MAAAVPISLNLLPSVTAYRARVVRDLMTPDPPTATPDTTVAEVFQLLTDGPVDHVPVVDRAGRLLGTVSGRDLLQSMPPPGSDPLQLEAQARFAGRRVGEVMLEALLTVDEEDPPELALALMASERLVALAVVDGTGRPVGVLSIEDVAAALAPDLLAGR
jgi:acetoin utilization protein AcuB